MLMLKIYLLSATTICFYGKHEAQKRKRNSLHSIRIEPWLLGKNTSGVDGTWWYMQF